MDWSKLAAIGQVASAVAVFITLLYLARQVRHAGRQARLDAYRQVTDSLSAWGRSIYESEEIAELVLRGRSSYDALSETERLRFRHVHHVLLNTLQLNYAQVQELAPNDAYRKWSEERLGALVRGYLDHPGVLRFWEDVRNDHDPSLRELIDNNTGDA